MALFDSLSFVSLRCSIGLLSSETADLQNSDQVFPTNYGEPTETIMLKEAPEQALIILLRADTSWAQAVEKQV